MKWPQFFGSKAYITFVVCLTIFTDVFLYGLVVPVLPYALVERAHVPHENLQFWNTVMLCSYAGTILIGSIMFGWLGDRLSSHRWTFISGQAMLLAATILFTFSRSLTWFLIARLVSGMACGAVLTVGYALLYDTVGSSEIGRAAGFTSMALGIAIFSGPLVGGFIYDNAGYEWVFAPALILVGLEIILRLCVIEPPRYGKSIPQTPERQSLLQDEFVERSGGTFGSSITSSIRAVYSVEESNDARFDEYISSKKKSPAVILMTDPRFVVNILALFVTNNIIGSIESILPVFTYEQLGFTSSQTSLLFLCITLPQLGAPLAGWMSDRYGSKWPALAGFALAGTSMILLQFAGQDSKYRLVTMAVLLTLFGISLGLTNPPVYAEVGLAVDDLERRRPGVLGDRGAFTLAFGLENCALGAGAFVGPIYASAVRERFGWSAMCITLGAVGLAMTIPIFLYTGGNRSDSVEEIQKDDSVSEVQV